MTAARLPQEPHGEGRQRIDKWIWFARMVKTRALAVDLVNAGHVRLNGAKVAAPGKSVRPGDVLTLALERQVRVLRVLGPGLRRGPYEEARLLYEDLNAGSAPDGPDRDGPT